MTIQEPVGVSKELTIVVFKDNLVSRAFQVPLRWISQAKWLAGIMIGILALSLYLAARYHHLLLQAQQGTPAQVAQIERLEQELSATKTQTESLQNQLKNKVFAPSAPVLPTPVQATQAATHVPSALLFNAVPAKNVSIVLHEPMVYWQGKSLRVHFNIQYIKEDNGNQSGRIVLLARGLSTLLAYPVGALNLSTSNELVNLSKGEHFSVSRYREVNASFGPIHTRESLQEVEVFVFGDSNELLIHQKLVPQKPAKP